jgi:hypothetical protein
MKFIISENENYDSIHTLYDHMSNEVVIRHGCSEDDMESIRDPEFIW